MKHWLVIILQVWSLCEVVTTEVFGSLCEIQLQLMIEKSVKYSNNWWWEVYWSLKRVANLMIEKCMFYGATWLKVWEVVIEYLCTLTMDAWEVIEVQRQWWFDWWEVYVLTVLIEDWSLMWLMCFWLMMEKWKLNDCWCTNTSEAGIKTE